MLLFAQLDPFDWEKENVMIREVGDQAELGTRRGSVNSVELMNKGAGGNLCPGASWGSQSCRCKQLSAVVSSFYSESLVLNHSSTDQPWSIHCLS